MKKRSDGRYVHTVTINGNKKFFYGKTPREAILKAENYEKEIRSEKPFSYYAKAWWETYTTKVEPGTWRSYEKGYKNAIHEFGKMFPEKITKIDIDKYLIQYIKIGLAHNTIKHYRWVMIQILEYALGDNLSFVNVAAKTKLPKGLPKSERKFPTKEEILPVENGINCHFGLFAYLIRYSGLRRGEALALTYEDIYNDEIHVSKSISNEHNKPRIKTPKTNNSIRTIPMPQILKEKIPKGKGFLFGGEKPITEQKFKRDYEKYRKESGVNIHPHEIRHYYCTWLFEKGIDVKTVQRILGHSDIQTTLNIYTHWSESRQTEIKNQILSLR